MWLKSPPGGLTCVPKTTGSMVRSFTSWLLVSSNWIRTFCWTARGGLVLWMLGLVALGGAAVAWLPFNAWADSTIASKATADLTAAAVALIAAGLAWRLGRVTRRPVEG